MEAVLSNPSLSDAVQKAELEQIWAEMDASQNRIKRNRAEAALLRRDAQQLKGESAQLLAHIRSTITNIREIK